MRRLFYIFWIASIYRIDTLLPPTRGHSWQFFLWHIILAPMKLIPTRNLSEGTRLKLTLLKLGPIFIKFGQMLSTRRDLLSQDLAMQLAELQDQVPPFTTDVAKNIIERDLGQRLNDIFQTFEDKPIASASIAQVHGATLRDGTKVVAKVVRPGIAKQIGTDLKLMKLIANKIERYIPIAKQLRIREIVQDYESTIIDELDMAKEALNTQKLRDNFPDSSLLYVPKVFWEYSNDKVLTLERIDGIPIGETRELQRHKVNMECLARKGVETFFTQVFVHNFFHADMHPGNIFVDIKDPENPSYIAVDCAIVGSLSESDQDYLARNLLAFLQKDFSAIADLHLQAGWVPEDTNMREFRNVIASLCEPIFAKPLSEISFGHFLVDLFSTARKFGMQIQPQLVLLQKTLLYIEGLGRQLYPQLDLWETAQPFMETWVAERNGPNAVIRSFAKYAPKILRSLPEIPALLANSREKLQSIENAIDQQKKEIDTLKQQLNASKKKSRRHRIIGAALLVLATFLVWTTYTEPIPNLDATGLSTALISAIVGAIVLSRA